MNLNTTSTLQYSGKTLIKQWDAIIRCSIPDYIMLTARTIIAPKYQIYGIGASILRRSGWREGTGIGANGWMGCAL